MADTSYESALQLAESLSHDDQVRLIQQLTAYAATGTSSVGQASVLELCGLGQEIWGHIDAQEYVNRERSSWNG